MHQLARIHYIALSLLLICCSSSATALTNFNFFQATPVGSWQERESIHTDHKGNESIISVKTSFLSSEGHGEGESYWIEMEVQRYKAKKHKRKPVGKETIIKVLVPTPVLTSKGNQNAYNFLSQAKEILVQTGNKRPSRIKSVEDLDDDILDYLGAHLDYHYSEVEKDIVEAKAGKFLTTKYSGNGTATMKKLFKKSEVKSKSEIWYSNVIPFGIVKKTITNQQDGKKDSMKSELVIFGKSGAVSKITQPAK